MSLSSYLVKTGSSVCSINYPGFVSKSKSSYGSPLKIGNDIDVMSSLFGKSSLLFRNGVGTVKVTEAFKEKYILVCCFRSCIKADMVNLQYLVETCSNLYSTRNDFEMVLVIMDWEQQLSYDYIEQFLHCPCLVVPKMDAERRAFICKSLHLGYADSFKCLLVDAKGNILLTGQLDFSTEHLQKLFPDNSVDFLGLIDTLAKKTWPVVRDEVKNSSLFLDNWCPIVETLRAVEPVYSDDINEMVSESSSVIETGQYCDVISLLSKGDLNYLDRNSGDRVEVEKNMFSDKYILICCFHVPVFRAEFNSVYIQSLVNACSDLLSTRNDFEMVVVAKMKNFANYEAVFNHFLSGFPTSCLAVPFQDTKGRDFICRYLNHDCQSIQCLLVDPKGSVLLHEFPSFVMKFGAEAFPFTKECRHKVFALDLPFWKTPSTTTLEGLLSCNASDVAVKISPAGDREEVTILELKQKVVGLYLCVEGNLIPKLYEIYQQCKAQQLTFEIVLVFIPFVNCLDPQVFMANIDCLLQDYETFLWRVPFNNTVSCRLKRLKCDTEVDKVIVVGANGRFVEPFGGEVMSNHGIDAYPFTRERLVQRQVDKLKEHNLESLLVYGSRNHVLQFNNPVPVAKLKDKNVILYLDSLQDAKLYLKLSAWYKDIKARDSTFEVVFVRLYRSYLHINDDDSELSQLMPWLVCPFDPDHSASVEEKIFGKNEADPTLLQFDKNGQLCTINAQSLLKDNGSSAFPFGDHLRRDVIKEFRRSAFHEFMDNMK